MATKTAVTFSIPLSSTGRAPYDVISCLSSAKRNGFVRCYWRPSALIIGLLSVWNVLTTSTVQARDYCSTESFHAHCPSGTVVLMTGARYGRMRLGRCVRVDFGFIGCSTEVLYILDRHCSGRTECRLRVPDAEMDETRPCLGDLTRYLEATYECIPVETADPHNCHGVSKLPLPLPSGFLLGPAQVPPLMTAYAAGPGAGSGTTTTGCTRVITASEGQRINLTLYDFGMMYGVDSAHGNQLSMASSFASNRGTSGASPGAISASQPGQSSSSTGSGLPPGGSGLSTSTATICRRLALITDVAAGTAVDVCAPTDGSRVTHAYLSIGSLIEIRLLRHDVIGGGVAAGQGPASMRHFLLRYNVTGCADLKLPSTYWVKRTESEATVGCFSNGKTWRLVCKDTSWVGEITNCTDDITAKLSLTSAAYHVQRDEAEPNDADSDESIDLATSLPTGLAATIIIVIAVSVGLCVAAIGILSLRRHRKSSTTVHRLHCSPPNGATADIMRFTSDVDVLPPPPASHSALCYAPSDLVPTASAATKVDYGLLPPEIVVGTCAQHRAAAACWVAGGDYGTSGHVTYCSCGTGRQRHPTGGGCDLAGGDMEVDDGFVTSPPDVATAPHQVYDDAKVISSATYSRSTTPSRTGTSGSATLHRHHHHHHQQQQPPPQQSQQQQQQQQQVVVCDKIYQDRFTLCKYSTFVGPDRCNKAAALVEAAPAADCDGRTAPRSVSGSGYGHMTTAASKRSAATESDDPTAMTMDAAGSGCVVTQQQRPTISL